MENKDFQDYLIKQHQENLSKFSYFLFGLSTASIGYAIKATEGATFSCTLALWLISTALLFLSGIFGVLYIRTNNHAVLDATMLAIEINKFKASNRENVEIPDEWFKTGSKLNEKANNLMNYQLLSLGAGYFMYFIWHISSFFK